jgi:tetratricopeptide (TPR) repeat protein
LATAIQTIRAGLLALATGFAPAVAWAGAGDYLAARQASFLGDYAAAAAYYGRTLVSDPRNPAILERAVLANIALGDIGTAAHHAGNMEDLGYRSQLAQMALLAEAAKAEDYAAVLAAIEDGRGVGPLADGLLAAWAQLGQGDMSAALVGFDAVAERDGLGPFSMYQKALALASVGDFESAEAILADGRAGGMAMTRRAIMARVEMLTHLGQFDAATALIDDAFGADLDPALTDMRATAAAGEVLAFTHVSSAREGMAEVFYTLSGALSNEDNDDLTLLYARLAQHLRPDHVDAILLAAEQLERLGQFGLAVDTYALVTRDSVAYHAAELGRAEALRRQDRHEDAVAVLEALTETHGHLSSVHASLGDTLRQMQRFAEASEAYTAALERTGEIDMRDWFVFYARGITYERQGRWDEAEADFRRALELNPDQPQVLNYLGYSLVEKQIKLDEALEMIERAVAAEPESGYIVDSLGWALYRLGRYEEAVVHMERAAELMPVDPVVNDHLGDVYWAVGRHLEAEFQWKRALSFAGWGTASEDVDQDRIRRKLEVGLDVVLAEEGAPPLRLAEEAGTGDED